MKVGILEFFCHILISITFTDSMYIHELNQEDVQDVPYPGIDISIKSLFLNKCQKMSPPPKKNEISDLYTGRYSISRTYCIK